MLAYLDQLLTPREAVVVRLTLGLGLADPNPHPNPHPHPNPNPNPNPNPGHNPNQVRERFGLGESGDSQTLNSIAQSLGVSQTRVRQIEAR